MRRGISHCRGTARNPAAFFIPGAGLHFGSPVAAGDVHDSNGVTNSAGSADFVQPTSDGTKYGIPTLSNLGITNASQIGILFNAAEPSGDSVSVTDLTLKFYRTNGLLLGAIDGQQNFDSSNPGAGVAGFTFTVSADEQAYVNGLIADGATKLALEATVTNVAGGAEGFLVYNINPELPVPANSVPEPTTLALVGLGLMGAALFRRRSESDQMPDTSDVSMV